MFIKYYDIHGWKYTHNYIYTYIYIIVLKKVYVKKCAEVHSMPFWKEQHGQGVSVYRKVEEK